MQANAGEEGTVADAAAAGEEGAESPVAGQRDDVELTAHRLVRGPRGHTDVESSSDVEELGGVAYITAAAAHHAGQSAESADGDDVDESVDGAAAVLLDEAALASAAHQSAAEHVRQLLDTPAALESGVPRQDHESLDSGGTGARHQDGGRRVRGHIDGSRTRSRR